MAGKILEGKKAVITGGSSGIGAAIAERLASEGADIWAAGGNSREGLEKTIEGCAAHGAKAGGDLYDLSNSRNAIGIVRDGAEFLGGLDILVNSAGTRNLNAFVDIEDDTIDLLFEVNAKAAFFASREAARIMVPQGSGHILMIGSDAGEHGTPNFALYGVTKAAMHALTKNLAIELGPMGLRVNCMAMGPVRSGRVKDLLENDPEFYKSRLEKIPIRDFGLPEHIADTALFIVSPSNNFMSGAIVMIDGGITAG
ncbi:SDR family NAD(P)-dependent oxidoreductase [Nitrospinota bacterium]